MPEKLAQNVKRGYHPAARGWGMHGCIRSVGDLRHGGITGSSGEAADNLRLNAVRWI